MTTAYSYVRFSTKGQGEGDSLRRQVEESRKYAASQGWTLDESLRDLGKSAFKGVHRKTGALAAFLKLCDEGKIETGSWLIVEAIDRLSREQVSTALTQFLKIVSAGVGIVTLAAVVDAVGKVQAEVADLTKRIESATATRFVPPTRPADLADLAHRLKGTTGDELVGLQQKLRLAVCEVVEWAKVWVEGNTVKRVAVIEVKLRDGQHRFLAVRCERGRDPVAVSDAALWTGCGPKDPEDLWAHLVSQELRLRLIEAPDPDSMRRAWEEGLRALAEYEGTACILPPVPKRRAQVAW
jgi:hypothetical protein